MSKELLEILVCPICKGRLEYDEKENVLICHKSRLKYPIEDDIPIMLPEKAEKF
ncbi:MAG: Trm112 family protein [Candidatus Latescibacterota bacterium]